MADSKVAKARKRLKLIAGDMTADDLILSSARVYLGNLAAENEYSNEFNYIASQPWLKIGSASMGFSGSDNPLVVDTVLTVPLAPSSVQDWANVDNLVAALRAAWLNAANYPSGEVVARTCDFDLFNVELRGDFIVVRVELSVAFENPD